MGVLDSAGLATTRADITTGTTFAAAATTNATVLKAAPGQLMNAAFFNFSAAIKYVKFYNKATAPTVGTDIPVFALAVPISGSASIPNAGDGMKFPLGIAFAVTGAAAISDTTALAANDVVGVLSYI